MSGRGRAGTWARPGLLALALGCGPPERGAATEAETTGATAATTMAAGPPESVLECGAASPCGVVLANAEGPGVPPATAYTAAQACALQQLAGGGPLRLHVNDGCAGTCAGALILVRGDGSAIVQPYTEVSAGGVDLGGVRAELAPFTDSEVCVVEAPAFFAACLADFDPACTSRARWFDGCARPAPAACTP